LPVRDLDQRVIPSTMKPTAEEISQLASTMRSWFKMTEEEAQHRATGFLNLAYGWGAPPTGAKLEQMIKRDLSKGFGWVSPEARAAFEASEAQRVAEYEIFISGRSTPPGFRL
jgi:hypothetical protein